MELTTDIGWLVASLTTRMLSCRSDRFWISLGQRSALALVHCSKLARLYEAPCRTNLILAENRGVVDDLLGVGAVARNNHDPKVSHDHFHLRAGGQGSEVRVQKLLTRVSAGVELRSAYITVLPEAGDAEGVQEVTAAEEEDPQLCREGQR